MTVQHSKWLQRRGRKQFKGEPAIDVSRALTLVSAMMVDALERRVMLNNPNTWIASGGGDWDTVGNWSLGHLPTINEDVVINLPASDTIFHSGSETDSVNSITSSATLDFSAGTISIGQNQNNQPNSNISGPLEIGSAAKLVLNYDGAHQETVLQGTGSPVLTNAGLIEGAGEINGWTIDNSGTIGGSAGLISIGVSSSLTNSGTIDSTGSGTTIVVGSSYDIPSNYQKQPKASETAPVTNTGTISGHTTLNFLNINNTGGQINGTNSLVDIENSIVSAGSITGNVPTVTSPTPQLTLGYVVLDGNSFGTLNTNGFIACDSEDGYGNIDIWVTGTINNQGTIADDGVGQTDNIIVGDGTVSQATLTGTGTIELGPTPYETGSAVSYIFGDNDSETLTIGSGQTIAGVGTIQDLKSLVNGGVIDADCAMAATVSQLGLEELASLTNSGTIESSSYATLYFEGTETVNTGTISSISSGATTQIANAEIDNPGGKIVASGGGNTQIIGGVVNSGTLDSTGSGSQLLVEYSNNLGAPQLTQLNGYTDGSLTIDGTLLVQGQVEVGGKIINNGNITDAGLSIPMRLNVGFPYGTMAVELAGNGTVDLTSASSTLTGFGTDGYSLTIDAGQTVEGTGSIQNLTIDNEGDINGAFIANLGPSGSLLNDGQMTLASTAYWTISSTFTQTASAVVNFELGGTLASQYGHFDLSGSVNLGGKLTASGTNGFTPTFGNVFTVFNYPAEDGTFSPLVAYSTQTLQLQTIVNQAHVTLSATAPGVNLGFYNYEVLGTDPNINQAANLLIDSRGDLFGVNVGENNFGNDGGWVSVTNASLYEVVAGTKTVTTLATFPGIEFGGYGAGYSPLAMDSAGDLYGAFTTLTIGGTYNYEAKINVYELPAGSHTVEILSSLQTTASTDSVGITGLAADNNGNVFLATQPLDTVFEYVNSTSTLNALYTFPYTQVFPYDYFPNGGYPGGLVVDGAGNLFGITQGTGADSSGNPIGGSSPAAAGGTVFEIPAGTSTAVTIASFPESSVNGRRSGVDGDDPVNKLVIDSQGDLYGETLIAGANGFGTAFELEPQSAPFSYSLNVLASLTSEVSNFISGDATGFAVDSDGNFWGVDKNQFSSVFEIALDSGVVKDVANNVYTPGDLAIDSAGNVFGTLPEETQPEIFELVRGAHLVYVTQPPSTLVAGESTDHNGPVDVVVQVEDQFGNVVTTDNSYLDLQTTPDSSGGATQGLEFVDGVADVPIIAPRTTGTYRLVTVTPQYSDQSESSEPYSVGGFTPVDSNSFVVVAAPATQIIVVQQPLQVTAGAYFTASVDLEDQYGNLATNDSSQIDITIGYGPSGSVFTGTTAATVAAGVANFNVALETAGGYALTYTDTTDNISQQVQFGLGEFGLGVSPAAASQLVFTQQPTDVPAGQSLATQVTIEDPYGNVITSDSSSLISLSAAGPGTLQGYVTRPVTAGVATFATNIYNSAYLTVAGAYTLTATSGSLTSGSSNSFNVIPGSPAQIVYTQQPPDVFVGQPVPLTVTVEDGYGNAATNYNGSVSLNEYGQSSGYLTTVTSTASAGAATFSLSLGSAGNYYVYPSGLSGMYSRVFTVKATPVATQLTFEQGITASIEAGTTLPDIYVDVDDQYGSVFSSYVGDVSLTLENLNTDVNTTVTATVQSGTATFSGITLDAAATYLVTASATAVNLGQQSFDVTPSDAVKLAFVDEPTGAAINRAVSPSFMVSEEDQFGNVVTSDSGDQITLTASGPGNLTGFPTASVNNGTATFSAVQFDTIGTYVVTASDETDSTITPAVLNSFVVSAPVIQPYAFAAANYAVGENAPFGQTTIQVVRSDASGFQTIDYVATPDNGFGPTRDTETGSVDFQPGQRLASFTFYVSNFHSAFDTPYTLQLIDSDGVTDIGNPASLVVYGSYGPTAIRFAADNYVYDPQNSFGPVEVEIIHTGFSGPTTLADFATSTNGYQYFDNQYLNVPQGTAVEGQDFDQTLSVVNFGSNSCGGSGALTVLLVPVSLPNYGPAAVPSSDLTFNLQLFPYHIAPYQQFAFPAYSEVTILGDTPDQNYALPVANPVNATTNIGQQVTIDALSNVTDSETQPLSIASFDQTSANGGTVSVTYDSTGRQELNYQPAAGFYGTDTFTFTAQDPLGESNPDTVTITVNPPVPPVAPTIDVTTGLDAPINIPVSDYAYDPNGFTLSFDSSTPFTQGEDGTVSISTDPNEPALTLRYIPTVPAFSGVDSFQYTVNDGNSSATGTVNVTIDSTPAPTVSLSDTVFNNYTYIPVIRTGDLSLASSVDFTTTDGTAVLGHDYYLYYGNQINFYPGEATGYAYIYLAENTPSVDKYFTLTLDPSTESNLNIANASATITIHDPGTTITSVTGAVGNSSQNISFSAAVAPDDQTSLGVGNMVFTIFDAAGDVVLGPISEPVVNGAASGSAALPALPVYGDQYTIDAYYDPVGASQYSQSADVQTTITTKDTTPPVITLNGANPEFIEATGPAGAYATEQGATAFDDISHDVTSSITSSIDFSHKLGLGTTVETYTAVDAAGNIATLTRTIEVVDTTPPVITLNGQNPLIVEATGPGGAYVTEPGVTAFDTVSGNVSVQSNVDFSHKLGLGTAVETYTAVDAAGNMATRTRTIEVVDTIPPVIALTGPNPLIVEATGPDGAYVTEPGATAFDTVSGNVSVQSNVDFSHKLGLGTTVETYIAVDAAGNVATLTRTIKVVDTTPPVLTLPNNITVTAFSATGASALFSASATDLVTASPRITYSFQPGQVFPIGVTTVKVTATDAAGNSKSGNFTVTVLSPVTISAVSVTGTKQIIGGKLVLSSAYQQTITINNSLLSAASYKFVLNGLPSQVTLSNSSGTVSGMPYYTFTKSSAATTTFVLTFSNPTAVPITYAWLLM